MQQFLVKWKDYPESASTWEPWENLKDTQALDTWEASHPSHSMLTISDDLVIDDEPKTRNEALYRKDADNWKKAMDDEYQSLINNKTWSIVPHPKD